MPCHSISASATTADFVHQRWDGLDRSNDLNAPALFGRTAPGPLRSAAAADATRPIAPAANGFRSINVVANRGNGPGPTADRECSDRVPPVGRGSVSLRGEVFNLLNHANILGRIGVYGNGAEPSAAFATPNTGMANLDPGRTVQLQVRYSF